MIDVEDGATYDVRARSISSLGNRSAFATTTHEVFGKRDIPSDVTNLSVNNIGKEAHLRWTPIADLDLSHYVIRHSSATSGATFTTSRTIASKVSRPANTAVVPALTGTYLIKAFDRVAEKAVMPRSLLLPLTALKLATLSKRLQKARRSLAQRPIP